MRQNRVLVRGAVAAFLWLSLASSPAAAQTLSGKQPHGPAAPQSVTCHVTPYSATPPSDSSTTAFTTTWYGQDRVWAGLDPLHQGEWYAGDSGNRTFWRWFVPGRLTVKGKRLDAPAPPMRASVLLLDGGQGYEAITLLFPVAGCWEVTGTVAKKVLRFTVNVHTAKEHRVSRPATSGVEGRVVIGPQCPVVEVGREDACKDKPYQASLVIKQRKGGREITRITTGPDGAFRVVLPPGTYVIEPLPGGSSYPYGKPEIVDVEPGTFTTVTIHYDTGIR